MGGFPRQGGYCSARFDETERVVSINLYGDNSTWNYYIAGGRVMLESNPNVDFRASFIIRSQDELEYESFAGEMMVTAALQRSSNPF